MVASTTITSALIANVCTGTAPGTFVLPYGTVNLAAALTIPSLCTLQGQGPGISIIKVAANTNFAAGAIVNSSQSLNKPGTLDTSIHLRNFTLDMNTANQSGFSYAIWMKNISYSSMEHVEVNGSGVLFSYAANINDLTLASYQHDLLFDGDWFHDAGITLAHDSDSLTITGQHVKVVNSTLGPSTDSGLASFGEGALDYIVSNNYFLNNQAVCGIAVGPGPNNVPAPPNARYATSQMTITGNTFTCSDISGNSYAVAISLGTGFTISGNVATMTPQAGSQTSPTISLEAVSDATVTGNQINGAKYDGIDIIAQGQETTQNVTVTGNVIRNPSQSCIYLLSSAGASAPTYLQNVSVTGNSCVDPGATAGITIAQASHVSPSETGNYNNVQVEGNGILDDRGGSATMTYGIAYNGFPTVSVAGNNVSGAVTASYSTPNNGAVSTYTNYLQSADRMQAGLITTSAGPSVTNLFSYGNPFAVGGFSPITQAGDVGEFFDVNNGLGTGGLTLAAHAATSIGVRIDGSAGTMDYWATTHTFHGDTSTTGNVTAGSGANIVYRCLTDGASTKAGVLTITAADCGSSTDTGLRVK